MESAPALTRSGLRDNDRKSAHEHFGGAIQLAGGDGSQLRIGYLDCYHLLGRFSKLLLPNTPRPLKNAKLERCCYGACLWEPDRAITGAAQKLRSEFSPARRSPTCRSRAPRRRRNRGR